jgi:eukaryotic-like serine/threonine-protein kinase
MSDDNLILIVDDDAENRTLLTRYLGKKGYQTAAVNNGLEALDFCEKNHVDLVLLDMMMPELNGLDTLYRLRARGDAVPVIMATAKTASKDMVEALDVGADDYITKPFDLAVLAARIEARLRIRKRIAEQPMPSFETGGIIDGRYQLKDIVGRGSFGVVYKARHLALEQDVAIKLLHAPRAAMAPFNAAGDRNNSTEGAPVDELRAEGVRACKVQHENAVRVIDVGETHGVSFLVMEFLEGPTVDNLLQAQGRVPLATVVPITATVLDVLAHAHSKRIVHRDVKPANVLMHGPQRIVKVLDFGVARLLDSNSQDTGRLILGSPAYLSPERIRGHAYDGRADVYATGVMLYELLTGQLPFSSDNGDLVAVALKHLKEIAVLPSKINPKLTPAVDAVVMRLLAKDAAMRPQAAQAKLLVETLLT